MSTTPPGNVDLPGATPVAELVASAPYIRWIAAGDDIQPSTDKLPATAQEFLEFVNGSCRANREVV